jgi:HEAT repeat protein
METAIRWLGIGLILTLFGCAEPARKTGERPPPSTTSNQPVDPSGSKGGPATSDAAGIEKELAPDSARPASAGGAGQTPLPAEPDAQAATGAEPQSHPTPPTSKTIEPGGSADDSWQTWAVALAGKDVVARDAASQKLDERGAESVSRMLGLMKNPAAQVRRGAAFYLIERFDASSAEIVPAFTAALADEDATVRHMALSIVPRFPPAAVLEAAPQLATMLRGEREGKANRAAIARLLGGLEIDARVLLPELVRAAKEDREAVVRSACLMAIARVAEPAAAAAAFRQSLKQDADANVRGTAAARLGRVGPAAATAAGDLANALADKAPAVCEKALEALQQIGAPAVPALTEKLVAHDPQVRRRAVLGLGAIGPQAKPALDALKKLLADPDQDVKQLADIAIRRIESGP